MMPDTVTDQDIKEADTTAVSTETTETKETKETKKITKPKKAEGTEEKYKPPAALLEFIRQHEAVEFFENDYSFAFTIAVFLGNPNGDPNGDNAPRIITLGGREHGLISHESIMYHVKQGIYLKTLEHPDGFALRHRPPRSLEEAEAEAWRAFGIDPSNAEMVRKCIKDCPELCELVKRLIKIIYFDSRCMGDVFNGMAKFSSFHSRMKGPIQVSDAVSVDPITIVTNCITHCTSIVDTEARMAAAAGDDAPKKIGEGRMGKRQFVLCGYYRGGGQIDAHLAQKAGMSKNDLRLFFETFPQMYTLDFGKNRGYIYVDKLIIFKHTGRNHFPLQALMNTVSIERLTGTPGTEACYPTDYRTSVNEDLLPSSITCKVIDGLSLEPPSLDWL